MTPENMLRCLALCHVPRWVIIPHSRPQSVAEHSYRVACIAMTMARELGWDRDDWDLLAHLAVMHDIQEAETGDTPSTAKTQEESKPIVTKFDAVLKIADTLEAATFILNDPALQVSGRTSRAATEVNRRLAQLLEKHPEYAAAADKIHKLILEEGV